MYVEKSDLDELLSLVKDIKIQLTKLMAFTISESVSEYLNASRHRADVFALCDGNHSVGMISEQTGIRQPNVSAVISDLLSKGLIKEKHKDGRSTYYVRTR